jgi:hypothetical protein
MRHSLHSHIIYLENKIQSLRDRLTTSRLGAEEIQVLEAQIYHAELALEHYRKAYALEISVSNPEPPDTSGPEFSDGIGASEKLKSEKKKKEGLVAFAARARKKLRPGLLPGYAAHRRNASARLR